MKKILILGGGFGGVYCAKRLQKMRLNSFDIELISDNNYFVFQPLLPEVASGTISASDAVTPIRQMLNNIKFRNAEVNLLDIKLTQGKLSCHLLKKRIFYSLSICKMKSLSQRL